jgi:hypothetical protein
VRKVLNENVLSLMAGTREWLEVVGIFLISNRALARPFAKWLGGVGA